MQKPNILKRVIKKCKIPIIVVGWIMTTFNEGKDTIDTIKLFFVVPRNEQAISDDANKIIQVEIGETRPVFDNSLLLITIDNISQINGTNLYRMIGKIDNGISTIRNLEMTQGESTVFDMYIIQVIKVASDYVAFRVSLKEDN